MSTLCILPSSLYAQFDFQVADRKVQIHSFGSQGFAYSNQNNYLTMKTSDGSFAMTDGGVNIATALTDKFRVGAQAYVRKVGMLGKGRVTLDWAVADYKFTDWIGVRAGKVKTTFGLYNDTQDMEFLHTWAIMPQSMYPLDLRASTIAHVGADVYGTLKLKKFGEVSYTAYIGSRPDDKTGGYYYGLQGAGISTQKITSNQAGADVRFTNQVKGLTFGASFLNSPAHLVATIKSGSYTAPLDLTTVDHRNSFYANYKIGNLSLDGEYSRQTSAYSTGGGADARGWYAAAAYRINKRLELGTYHSRYIPDAQLSKDPATNHIFDTVAAARIDVSRYIDVKVEGHFIDGYGSPYSFRGFYPQENTTGIKPKTNMLVLRMGFNL